MRWKNLYTDLRLFWWRTDKVLWMIALFFGLILGGLAFALQAVLAAREEQLDRIRETHARDLTCLAENVYYEARGEPLAGQYAVAEVTMNRKASRLYPRTICEVVHQQNWDPIRGRYVGAFSWTELSSLPAPGGEEWERAWKVAQDVYYQRHTPALQGAVHYHANYIDPAWASEKKRVARIGRHIFYR
jgi:N-acetylmuramoyl-L-alanine amidase